MEKEEMSLEGLDRGGSVMCLLYYRGALTGEEIRKTINQGKSFWFRYLTNSLVSFYFLMMQLEDDGIVERIKVPVISEGVLVGTRIYFDLTDSIRTQLADLKEAYGEASL